MNNIRDTAIDCASFKIPTCTQNYSTDRRIDKTCGHAGGSITMFLLLNDINIIN